MKKVFLILGTLLLSLSTYAAMNVNKIDPPFWYTGMQNPELQLMVYGEGIGNAAVSVNYPGVSLSCTVKLESNNYLLVYLKLDKDVKPGKFNLTFTEGKKKLVKEYELKARNKKGCEHKGFDASDALYLLMPDRFANGNPDNDQIAGMADYKVDPRFGTNEEYKQLIEKAHARGIKIVMDMIFNHCGVEHVWIKDMPSKDWFNNPDHENNFVQTSFKLTPHVDPYTSQYDADQMNDGWFVPSMPDLNQKNPHVYRYLVQNSFWWIEFANIDGIRMDTYPYADYDAMSNWMKELNEEYPNYNTVGETWVTEPAYTAWWQKDSKLSAPKNSNLKTVMDFSFFDKINTAKNEQTETWFKGLDRIYNNFVYDFLYPNPASVLAFIENHDTDRFLGEGDNLPMLKQASTLLLTTRRIPQLYYGTEIMMNGVKSKSDGYVRKDFPGGWTGDATTALTATGRTKIQNECYDFYKTLLNCRKGNDVIAKGSMVQFMVQNGVYAYARQYEGKTIFVMLNGTDAETTVPLKFYKEILKNSKQGKDILSGKAITFGEELKMGPRESLVIEL